MLRFNRQMSGRGGSRGRSTAVLSQSATNAPCLEDRKQQQLWADAEGVLEACK